MSKEELEYALTSMRLGFQYDNPCRFGAGLEVLGKLLRRDFTPPNAGLCFQHQLANTQVMVTRDTDQDEADPIAELRHTSKRGWVLWEISSQEHTLSTEEVVAIGAKLRELTEESQS